jgi:hypothetical protein
MPAAHLSRGSARWREWRLPLLAWTVSRVIGFVALVVTPTPDGRWVNGFGLTTMDGRWYRIIITEGYPNWSAAGVGSAWPFFPLYPWLADMPTRVGAPIGPSMIAVSWLAALVALGGVWRLARARFDARVAALAVWLVALLPGSIGMVLSYSDSLFVAGLVWALVYVDDAARAAADGVELPWWAWWRIGAVACVATASRPNGFLLVLVLWIAVWCVDRRWRHVLAAAVPSALFLAGWMVYCQRKVGDALVFLSSKDAWIEWPLWRAITDPLGREAVPFHMIVGIVVIALAVPSVRRVPPWWTWCAVLMVVPQLLLGVEGLARYVTLAVPLPIAGAVTLARCPRPVQWATIGAAGAGMFFLGVWVVRYSWVP